MTTTCSGATTNPSRGKVITMESYAATILEAAIGRHGVKTPIDVASR